MAYERKTFDLIISDELRELLSEIENDSLVAKLLLKKRHDKESLVEDPINFVSIAHDRTKISYLTQDRISKIEDPSLYWSSSRRFAVKPGGFISKLFKDIPAKEVEKFSNLYRALSNKPKFTIKVVEGGEILKYYHYKSYAGERGTLGASCMKHDGCQDYLGVYTENTNRVKMLVMLNSDEMLLGRALLWNLGEHKIMDRIYTISDEEFSFHFKKWATDNGYLYKSEQNWYNTLNFENLKTPKHELKIEIKLDNFQFRRYPYVDTFKFFDDEKGILLNYMPSDNFKTLCASDGGKYGSDYLAFDEVDRILRHRGDTVYLRYLNVRTHSNNTYYSDIHDEYILCKDSIHDGELGDYIFNEEYDRFNNKERIKERKDYLIKRREEIENREKSRRRKKHVISSEYENGILSLRSSWLESFVGTGIPSRYFEGIFDDILVRGSVEPQNQNERQSQNESENQSQQIEDEPTTFI